MNEYPPCTRCGDCCKEEICPMGIAVYKVNNAPCPGLKFDNQISFCELIKLMTEDHFAFMSMNMGIGIGCTNEVKKENGKSKPINNQSSP